MSENHNAEYWLLQAQNNTLSMPERLFAMKKAYDAKKNEARALKQEIERLKSTREGEADRWIAVGERLPEDGDNVLCWCADNEYYIGFIQQGEWRDLFEAGGTYQLYGLTHWRELPEPPQEGIPVSKSKGCESRRCIISPTEDGLKIKCSCSYFKLRDFIRIQKKEIAEMQKELNASEALYTLFGWLTARDEPITLSAKHDASEPAKIVGAFCKQFNLTEPRSGWMEGRTVFEYPLPEPPQTGGES